MSAPYHAPMHRVTTLPGGLRVASEHMDGLRSVSVGFWIDAGARDERPDQRGLAHFIEHLLFKGGARHDATAIAELFDELGAELNAATAKDSTLLYARVLDDHLPIALDVMTDMLRSPSWSEIEQEREVVLEEIAMVEDAPQDAVHDLATLAMFGEDDPLGHPILGEPAVIGSAQIANVAEFHRAAYGDPVDRAGGGRERRSRRAVRARRRRCWARRRRCRAAASPLGGRSACRVGGSSSRTPSSSTSASAGPGSPAPTTIASRSRCST